jgi:dihydroneopterin aldolase
MNENLPLRVVKVGGSLLDWPPLAQRLNEWLSRQRPARNILIAGGGKLTDAVRELQKVQHFDDETAHWMCASALSATARMLTAMVPGGRLRTRLSELREHEPDQYAPQIFDAGHFLHELEDLMPGDPLPHDWTATSDSIAARLAALLGAYELVLLKSAAPPNAKSLAPLAEAGYVEAGYVDAYFTRAAADVARVSFVNLRAV